MSNTRKADPAAPPSWERYMSGPEFRDMRGLPGAAVAAKAGLLTDARKRSLLFFLQALSCRQGGLKKLATDILAAFPERIGSPTMHRLGTKAHVYSEEDAETIYEEIGLDREMTWDDGAFNWKPIPRHERTREFLIEKCRASGFARFLGELCSNPRMEIRLPREADATSRTERASLLEEHGELDFTSASLPWFDDVIGALLEYQERHAATVRADLAETEVSAKVFSTLDRALRHRKMVVIEGEPGFGKTKAVQTWCEMHLGEARFVTLSGCVNKTSIFHKMELALGLSFGQPKKSTQMQTAVESMLKRSGLMLVIDEAHFLLGQGERIAARPEMLDWVDTSCCNEGVAVALIATPQFAQRLAHVERRTLWQSNQFRRRIKDYVRLPAKMPHADVEAVARKLLPDCGSAGINLLVGQALLSQYPLSSLANAVEDAGQLAREDGREKIAFRDLDRAIREFRVPSELAQRAAFDAQPKPKRGRAAVTRSDRQNDANEPSARLETVPARGGLAVSLPADNRLANQV